MLRYENCTQVQAAALPPALAGKDVVVKAKTGTGKTLGFCIPAFERLLAAPPPPGRVGALIVSPTRELAAQIGVEAAALATFHGWAVQVVVGGTNVKTDVARLRDRPPAILVATPGRMNDLLSNFDMRPTLSALRVLVFDEADRLLDMGFRPAIDALLKALPPKDTRQAMLFSATYPRDIASLVSYALRPGAELVDTVGEADTQTAARVEQTYLVTPMDRAGPALWAAIAAHAAVEPDFKVMVFFVTARITQFYAELFAAAGAPVLEMHSRKSQPARTKAAAAFREGTRTVMFSSDVSARGVDYPDVSLVIQVGLPSEKAQYVHRVGRTARAGKAGRGLLLLEEHEAFFLRDLTAGGDVPITPAADQPSPAQVEAAVPVITAALGRVSSDTKDSAYRTWLGFYKGYLRALRWDPATLVAQGTRWAGVIACPVLPPPVEKQTVGKMGLKGVPGLNIVPTNNGIEIRVRYITRAFERHETRLRLNQAVVELMHGPRGDAGSPGGKGEA